MVLDKFDIPQVEEFTRGLIFNMDQCDNGDGSQCTTIDLGLRNYGSLCQTYCESVRRWGRAVFTGAEVFDPGVQTLLSVSGHQLLARARVILARGNEYEDVCEPLQNKPFLEGQIQVLERLLKGWVTPARSVGPAAHYQIEETAAEKIKSDIAALPQLPAGWQPADPRQKAILQRTTRRR